MPAVLKFIQAGVLACCLTMVACAPGGEGKPHADEPGVRKFLQTYFETWSNRDMDGYGACFHTQARIAYLAGNGRVVSEGVTDFLHSQRMAHEQAASPMKEVPLNMTIQMDDRVAQASVTWLLTKKGSEERGTDFFTLQREGKSWKIISLVFYGE